MTNSCYIANSQMFNCVIIDMMQSITQVKVKHFIMLSHSFDLSTVHVCLIRGEIIIQFVLYELRFIYLCKC